MRRAVPRGDEQPPPTERTRRLDVAQAVADPVRPREVDAQRRLRVAEQLHPRLAALARPRDLGMMGTVVCRVEVRAVRREQLAEPALHSGERRSEEHTSELQSLAYLVCRLLLEKKKNN